MTMAVVICTTVATATAPPSTVALVASLLAVRFTRLDARAATGPIALPGVPSASSSEPMTVVPARLIPTAAAIATSAMPATPAPLAVPVTWELRRQQKALERRQRGRVVSDDPRGQDDQRLRDGGGDRRGRRRAWPIRPHGASREVIEMRPPSICAPTTSAQRDAEVERQLQRRSRPGSAPVSSRSRPVDVALKVISPLSPPRRRVSMTVEVRPPPGSSDAGDAEPIPRDRADRHRASAASGEFGAERGTARGRRVPEGRERPGDTEHGDHRGHDGQVGAGDLDVADDGGDVEVHAAERAAVRWAGAGTATVDRQRVRRAARR